VPREKNNFFCAWPMIHARNREIWIQAGWEERGEGGEKQFVFKYDTVNKWQAFEQVYPGMSIKVAINHQRGGVWAAWLWKGDRWALLDKEVDIGLLTPEVTSVCGEVCTTGTTFYVPPIRFNPVHLIINNRMEQWTQQYPTKISQDPPYYARWYARYHDWEFYGGR